MRYPYRSFQQKDDKRYVFGRFIREQNVYVIDQNNTNLGLLDTRDALQLAQNAGLELVLVSQGKQGNASTCKILDFGKFKYEQEKREKVTKKKQRENAIKIKEVKLRPTTDENDLKTKAKQLQEFMAEGNRLKVSIIFRGREMAHKDIGVQTLNTFANLISAKFDSEPSMVGRNLNAVLIKKSEST